MKFWDNCIKLLIVQGIIAVIIIASVLILKFAFKDTYNEFKSWYSDNVFTDTDVYEVIG